MAGVIDKEGNQWERCNVCSRHVLIDELMYEEPSKEWPYGRDVCEACSRRLKLQVHHQTFLNLNLKELDERS